MEFIKPIANSNSVYQSLSGQGVGSSFFLLTIVDPNVLKQAREILHKIEKKVKKLTRSKKGNEQFTVSAVMGELVELSNEYYDLIPPMDVSNSALRPIQSTHEVE